MAPEEYTNPVSATSPPPVPSSTPGREVLDAHKATTAGEGPEETSERVGKAAEARRKEAEKRGKEVLKRHSA